MKKKRIGILTGGGDTQPLNVVIFTLSKYLKKSNFNYIGFLKGWRGVLNKEFVNLKNISDFSNVGGSFLKSSRVNLCAVEEGIEKANKNLEELSVEYLIVIGGDDTLSSIYDIKSCKCIGISKTIDNDVGSIKIENGKIRIVNYFTLGYPTAANQISSFASLGQGVRTTAYSHERIIILESMGMHAGWLALASAFGKPDFIIVPEFPLNYSEFVEKLKMQYSKKKNSVIVIAEGAKNNDGTYIQQDTSEMDDFGNARFGGSSFVLRDRLKKDLQKFMNVRNINAVNPSYLYRSGSPNQLDKDAGIKIADKCSELIREDSVNVHQFVSIEYDESNFKANNQEFNSFKQTMGGRFPRRYLNKIFYDTESYAATDTWFDYLEPIVKFESMNILYKGNYEVY